MKRIIYGAGNRGKSLYKILEELGVKVDYFMQTSVENSPKYLLGCRILSIDELININDAIIFIAIEDVASRVTVMDLLSEYNIKTVIDCCDYRRIFDFQCFLDFEKNMLMPYWEPLLIDKSTIDEKVKKLVAGLDEREKAKVFRIIELIRAELFMGSSAVSDMFSLKEKTKMNIDELRRQLVTDRIDYFEYKGYKLRENGFCPEIFDEKYGLKLIDELGDLPCAGDIIDAGAYNGDSALVLSEYTKGNVYAFEPFEESYLKLTDTIQLNERNNIIPIKYALGEKKEKMSFHVRSDGETGHGIVKRDGLHYKDEISVLQLSLDEFVENEGLKIGIIKTDVEGAEQALLRGAKRTIMRDKPILIISIYHTASDFFDIKSYIEDLHLGYRFKIVTSPSKNWSCVKI